MKKVSERVFQEKDGKAKVTFTEFQPDLDESSAVSSDQLSAFMLVVREPGFIHRGGGAGMTAEVLSLSKGAEEINKTFADTSWELVSGVGN